MPKGVRLLVVDPFGREELNYTSCYLRGEGPWPKEFWFLLVSMRVACWGFHYIVATPIHPPRLPGSKDTGEERWRLRLSDRIEGGCTVGSTGRGRHRVFVGCNLDAEMSGGRAWQSSNYD